MSTSAQFPTVAPWPGDDDGDEGRTVRGLHIAASTPYIKVPGGWITPSQSDPTVHYRLSLDEDGPYCSCPDPEPFCKHVRGLQFMLEREKKAKEMSESLVDTKVISDHEPKRRLIMCQTDDARNKQSDSPDFPVNADITPINLDVPMRSACDCSGRESPAPARRRIAPATVDRKRPTYQQDWPKYNAAQRNEKAHFRHLLRDLVALAEEPAHLRGRRPHTYSDQIFSLVFKMYTGLSWRRFDTDLREAMGNQFINTAASTSTLARYMDDPALTPILHDLILCSALPMKGYDTCFAIDGTGFNSDRYARWFTEKWGKVVEHHGRDWAKLHLVCGTDTHIITCAEVSDWRDHDNKYFEALVAATSDHFDVRTVAADKAYTSRRNMTFVDDMGAVLYAPFKSNVRQPDLTDNSAWARMLRMFLTDHDGWKEEYHKRSIVEAVISTMKRLFGGQLDSRNDVAQGNELLCRVIAHNLVVIIHMMYERDLVPEFHLPD